MVLVKASALGIAAIAALPLHILVLLASGTAALILLIYVGIALPAVWSAKPARRKAAAAVLRQILDAWTSIKRR